MLNQNLHLVNTDLFRFFPQIIRYLAAPVIHFFLLTPEEGAQTTLHCTLDPLIENGAYYSKYQPKQPTVQPNDPNTELLWDYTEKLLDIHLKI